MKKHTSFLLGSSSNSRMRKVVSYTGRYYSSPWFILPVHLYMLTALDHRTGGPKDTKAGMQDLGNGKWGGYQSDGSYLLQVHTGNALLHISSHLVRKAYRFDVLACVGRGI
jgi:hypothetical protein